MERKFPIGTELTKTGAHFRVYAGEKKEITLHLNSKKYKLEKDKEGYFSLFVKGAKAGAPYLFEVDQKLLPDPASRYQPKGPNGPSLIVDPKDFKWKEKNWKGIESLVGQVLYEMHVGTFTKEGTWAAATKKLPELAELGITIIEMMPICDFVGRFGWGYDGVNLFAPTHLYGACNDLKKFIELAHQLNMGVILDVVYNHFGPGETLTQFSDDYLHTTRSNEWGKSVNFESKNIREFFLTNALYWLEEYHFDGLRIDATQNIIDFSEIHILREISEQTKTKIKRKTVLIAESENQRRALLAPFKEKGYAFDAVWNDDFHHSAIVRLTQHNEAYYSPYQGSNQELISSLKWGYLYQGQYYHWQEKNRGESVLDCDYDRFVIFLQNHDQIANSSDSLRLTTSGKLRAMTLLLILSPQIPLLFQGQEWGATSPFSYFADQDPYISKLVWEGRKQFLSQFPSFKDQKLQNAFPDPGKIENFLKCKLNWEERKDECHQKMLQFHKDLIKLRKDDSLFSAPEYLDGSILNEDIFLMRYFGRNQNDRLILFNLGLDKQISSFPDPLYAPPKGHAWNLIFSTEDPTYGGSGTPPIASLDEWQFKGNSAMIFKATRES